MLFTGFRKEYNKAHAAEGRQLSLLNPDTALIKAPHQWKISLEFQVNWVLANPNQAQLN